MFPPRQFADGRHDYTSCKLNQEKNTQLEDKNRIPGFGSRLERAFVGYKKKEIADKIGVSRSAVTNYVQDRVPEPEILLNITKSTGCSLHWLLTGEGPQKISQLIALSEESEHKIDLEEVKRKAIQEFLAHLVGVYADKDEGRENQSRLKGRA